MMINAYEEKHVNSYSKILIYGFPIFLLLIFFLKNYYDFLKIDEYKKKEQLEISNLEILIDEGYYKEAHKRLKRHKNSSNKAFLVLQFRALIGMKNYISANKLLNHKDILNKDKDLVEKFYELLLKAGKESLAYKLINRYKDLLGEAFHEKGVFELLSVYRKIPFDKQFVAGWFDGRGIVKDERGFSLINRDGNLLSPERYEELRAFEKGFCAKRDKHWVILNKNGKFEKLIEEDENRAMDSDKSYVLEVNKKVKNNIYLSYKGRRVTRENFDNISNVSDKGVAFASKDGKHYKLIWPALED